MWVFNNTLNITKFYYQFQQQKVYSIKVDKMFNLIFYAYKRKLKKVLVLILPPEFSNHNQASARFCLSIKGNICNI